MESGLSASGQRHAVAGHFARASRAMPVLSTKYVTNCKWGLGGGGYLGRVTLCKPSSAPSGLP